EKNFTYILEEKSDARKIVETPLLGSGTRSFRTDGPSTFALRVRQDEGSAGNLHDFSLGEVYPNPFNPTAHISFTVPSDAYVRIKVYSVLGQEVATLVDGIERAGVHHRDWNGARE